MRQSRANTADNGQHSWQGRISFLHHVPVNDCTVNIIVIPDLGVKLTPGALNNSWSWLSSLVPSFEPYARILAFDMTLTNEDIFTWETLALWSIKLLEDLFIVDRALELFRRPLIFVCHGLGGIMVKYINNIAHKKYHDLRLRTFCNAQRGICFLGTPNPTYFSNSQWVRLGLLVVLNLKSHKAIRTRLEGTAGTIVQICSTFCETGVSVAAMSVYEAKKTKVSVGILSSRKEILVDKEFAATGNAKLVSSDADHTRVCDLGANDAAFIELKQLIASAKAHQTVIEDSTAALAHYEQEALDTLAWESPASSLASVRYGEPGESGTSQPGVTIGSSLTEGSFQPFQGTYAVMPAITETFTARRSAGLPCYLMDPVTQNPHFVGRQRVLRDIDDVLLPTSVNEEASGNVPQSMILSGPGGIGKTQIAIEYLFSRQELFDAIFWIQADDANRLNERLCQIAIRLGLVDAEDESDHYIARNMVMEWLAQPHRYNQALLEEDNTTISEVKWLLVFDNVDNIDLLHDFWPINGRGSIIITTRDSCAVRLLDASKSIHLEALASGDAARLLQDLCNDRTQASDNSNPDAVALASRCHNHPLAISHLAAVMKRHRMGITQFEEVDKISLAVFLYGTAVYQHHNNYRHNPLTVWKFESLTGGGRNLLVLLALLSPEGVHEMILKQAIARIDSDCYHSTIAEYFAARASLLQSSILKHDQVHKIIALQPLVQDAALYQLEPKKLEMMFALAVDVMTIACAESQIQHCDDTKLQPSFETLHSHILRLQEMLVSHQQMKLSKDTLIKWSNLSHRSQRRDSGSQDSSDPEYEDALSR